MAKVRVAVDVGGTFTDICVMDEDSGAVEVAKVPSTADPIEGVLAGVKEAGVDLHDVVLSHGTTVATKALLTRRFPPAAMVTTKGFRDVLEIRRGTKDDLWDAYKDVAPPYIRRRDRFEVGERIDYSGRVVTDLGESEARRVAAVLRKRGVQTVAVCFINAYANPAHEQRMRAIRGGAPGGRNIDVRRGPAGDLRARALLDDRRECGARATRRRLRGAARRPARGGRLRGRPFAPPLGRWAHGVWLNKGTDAERFLGAVFADVAVRSGDTFTRPSAGGGGFGDPLERDPEAVKEDVADGYVSIERARKDYGVAVREIDAELSDYEVDLEGTGRERARIRAERWEWLDEDPEAVADRFRSGELDTIDLIHRYCVIIDWGTGELFPETTKTFRAMLRRRAAAHWPPAAVGAPA